MALYAEGGHVAKRARVDYSTSPTPITTLQLTAGTTPHLGLPAAVTASSTANTAGPITNNIPLCFFSLGPLLEELYTFSILPATPMSRPWPVKGFCEHFPAD